MNPYIAGGLWLPSGPAAEALAALTTIPNKAHAVAVALREKGKRVPLPDERVDPCCYRGPWVGLPRASEVNPAPEDRRTLPPALRLTHTATLRPYQREALAAWWRGTRNGVIEAPCGAGKTMIGTVAAASVETPALVLVHTRDLLAQWVESGARVGVEVVGVAEGAGPTAGRVVVATMQTAITWAPQEREAWGAGFGLVIVDEAHHAPCATLGALMYDLPGRYRLGLTATPERADGLTPIMHGHLGPTVARIDRGALVVAGVTFAPVVHRVPTGWAPREGMEYGEMVSAACDDPGRNDVLLTLARRLVEEGRSVLVQTERRAHAEYLAGEIGEVAVAVTGDVSAKERARRLAAVRDGTLRVLVATQLADEGLDLPGLDALVVGVPQRNAARLEQRVGRVSRSAPGKTRADVYDLADGGTAARLWYARAKVYRALGCEIR